MKPVMRSVVVVRPKAPYAKWANLHSLDEREYSLAMYQSDCIAFLIPRCLYKNDAQKYIRVVWMNIFDYELNRLDGNTTHWPADRTLKMFRQWFDVEFHAILFDITEDPLLTI